MATPVPYQGIPDVAPRLEPTPGVGINTPPAAFGTNIAEATSHMGQVIEGSGKELFDRAYAMQELQVHADVNARLAAAQNEMSNHYVQFTNLEGKNAVDGLTDYQNKLDEIRQKGGDGLSPIGQEFYDTESRNWRNRFGMYGAAHAGQEQKRYIVGSVDAKVAASTKMMEVNPDDPNGAAAAIQNIRDQVAHKFGDIGGMSPEEVKQKQNDAVNDAVQGRIRALAKDQPIAAQKLFDQAVKGGDLYGNNLASLGWYIRNQRDVIGSRNTVDQVFRETRGEGGPVLRALFQNESGGKLNITNPQTTTSGHAQGVFQITTGTWHEFAERAGVQLAAWPTPNSAPYEVQAKVASIIPLRRWDHTTLEAMQRAGAKLDPNATLGENLAANGEGLGQGVTKEPALADLVGRGRSLAADQFPDDPNYQDIVEDKIITQYNKELALRRDTDFQNEQTIANTLLSGIGPDKKLPTTVEELRLDPNASQAWDALEAQHPTELKKFLNQMASNAKGDVAMTGDRLNEWQKLSGEAIADPEKFVSDTEDLSKLDLPRAQKLEVIRMRDAIHKKQDAAPQMGHALSIAGPMLDSLGLTKASDPDKRNLFIGIMHDAMTVYSQQNGKPMNDQEIKDTAQRLLNPVASGGLWGMFGSKTPWFESKNSVPPEIEDTIRQDFESRGITPDDNAILSAYIASQYNNLYGKPTKAQVPKP